MCHLFVDNTEDRHRDNQRFVEDKKEIRDCLLNGRKNGS